MPSTFWVGFLQLDTSLDLLTLESATFLNEVPCGYSRVFPVPLTREFATVHSSLNFVPPLSRAF